MKEYVIRVENDGRYAIYESYGGRPIREIKIPTLSLANLELSRILSKLPTFQKGAVDYDYDAEEVKEDKNGRES